jgi:hypothetical protein
VGYAEGFSNLVYAVFGPQVGQKLDKIYFFMPSAE